MHLRLLQGCCEARLAGEGSCSTLAEHEMRHLLYVQWHGAPRYAR
jgi:hypothetical protein